VYACTCSRKDIQGDSDAVDRETRYSGRCRSRGLAFEPGRGIRVALAPGVEHFCDAFLGEQQQDPSTQCGDLLVRDRTGNWTYQFAVTVDDLEQEIDLVIRGEDLLSSTGRQIRLGRLLGRARPAVYLHHPLIRHPSGAKLSKANRDTGIRDLRRGGATPAAVLGLAAHLSGLLPEKRDLGIDELPSLFVDCGVRP
jgi:glutamyl-tRNA synthetase/glutamyl-Q tRNA(Asp) synthetase